MLHEKKAIDAFSLFSFVHELLLDTKRFPPLDAPEIQEFTLPHKIDFESARRSVAG
jgi:hypothetical protein